MLFAIETGELIYPHRRGPDPNPLCKATGKWNEQNPIVQLKAWHDKMDNIFNDVTISMPALSEAIDTDAVKVLEIVQSKGRRPPTFQARLMGSKDVFKIAFEKGTADDHGRLMDGPVELKVVEVGPPFPILMNPISSIDGFVENGELHGPGWLIAFVKC